MALQVQIWIKSIIENLFADNSFASKSVDHSEFVNEKTVHVPNAGAASSVVKNRTTFPAAVTTREDVDLSYDIDEFSVDPIRIPNADKVELSYNKRESIIRGSRNKLADDIHASLIYSWIPSGVNTIFTEGAAVTAHIASATGNRKSMTKASVEAAQLLFDSQNIPQTGRYMLLDAYMYNQLKNSMTNNEVVAFLAGADPEKGVIGEYAGFRFYKRGQVAKTTKAGVLKEWNAAADATDSAAGIAWQEDCVSRALGASILFDDEGNPLYYGDIISFLQRAGGSYIRSDKKGVALICQATEEPSAGG